MALQRAAENTTIVVLEYYTGLKLIKLISLPVWPMFTEMIRNETLRRWIFKQLHRNFITMRILTPRYRVPPAWSSAEKHFMSLAEEAYIHLQLKWLFDFLEF